MDEPSQQAPAALPDLVVIGAMKCATTALHAYLDAHPAIAMWCGKEANFFTGDETAPPVAPEEWWRHGQWHRGVDWYASLFDPFAKLRGESSPGYTAPDNPLAAERMAKVVPQARLICLVREPVQRAASQFAHHVRDGDERRPIGEALLDPKSQYVDRSRYHDRLGPFLAHFPREQVLVVVQERLRDRRRAELRRVYEHVGADPGWWDDSLEAEWHVGGSEVVVPDAVAARFRDDVADDVTRLRDLLDDEIPEWDQRRSHLCGSAPLHSRG
jgi:hypothetical protein